VIDARAHDGKAERDIDRVAEADELHRNGRLVMVHRDDCIVPAGVRFANRRLRPHRALERGGEPSAKEALLGPGDPGGDGRDLLTAEQPLLSRVRIESGYGNARAPRPKTAHKIGREENRRAYAGRGQRARDVGQGQVGGDQRDDQFLRPEGHDHLAGAEPFGEMLGVASKLARVPAGRGDRVFRNGPGHESPDRARRREIRCLVDPRELSAPRARRRSPEPGVALGDAGRRRKETDRPSRFLELPSHRARLVERQKPAT
jgi:hypothetical protein